MSYPRKVKLFRPWAQAMVEGATVDSPDYGKKASKSGSTPKTGVLQRRKRRRKRRRRKHAKET